MCAVGRVSLVLRVAADGLSSIRAMPRTSTLAALVWVCLAVSGLAQSTSDKWVTLRTDQIPEHALWREAFNSLDEAQKKNWGKPLVPDADGQYQPLRLTDKDMKALSNEAAKQPKRDADCLERQQRAMARITEGGKKKPDYMTPEILTIQIDCRQEVLDAAQRVEDALSEEGRATVKSWIDYLRQHMTVEVRER